VAENRETSSFAKTGINIDYIYASAYPDRPKAYLVLRTHQMAEAERVLGGGR
jgi:hypothetical protein